MQAYKITMRCLNRHHPSLRASPSHCRQLGAHDSSLAALCQCAPTRFSSSRARSRVANPVVRKLPPVVTPELTAGDLSDEQHEEERLVAGAHRPGKHPLSSILIEDPPAIGYEPWRPGMPDRWQWPLYGASQLPPVPPAAAAFAAKLFRSGAQYVGDETDFCVPGVPLPSWTELPVLGRSNVGKSSLLNALLGSDDAAFVPVSSTPGSTRHLDFYAVGNASAQGKLREAQLQACGMDAGEVAGRGGAATAGTVAAVAALAAGAALDNVTLASLLTAEEVREELIATAPLGGAPPRKPASVAGAGSPGGRRGGAGASRDGAEGRRDGRDGKAGGSRGGGRRAEQDDRGSRKAERHAAAMAGMQAQFGRSNADSSALRGPPHGLSGGVSLGGSSAAALSLHHDTSTLSAVARARNKADLVLVDTPGYGYNAAGLGAGAGWARLIRSYLKFRTGLQATLPRALVLIDARVGITPLDAEVLRMLDDEQVPYHMVLTKADALSRVELESRIDAVARAASELSLPYPVVNAVSAHTGAGLAELMGQLMLSTKLSRRLNLHGDRGGSDSRS